jgi:DNA-binding response OmpR family regulator
MRTASVLPIAVVIESDYSLANVLNDVLSDAGYDVILSLSHQNALRKVEGRASVSLLAACVPAKDDDCEGCYLDDRRSNQGQRLATVVMLLDNTEPTPGVPDTAIRLTKPFDRTQFLSALRDAENGGLRLH